LRIVAAFKNKRVAAVTPGIHVKAPQTLLQHMQRVEYLLGVFNRYAFAGLGSVFITPGPFSIFRAETIREVGGWHHGHSTEDMELGLRLQSRGWMITNEPEAEVRTTAPRTLRTLVRQRVRWSYGFLRNVFDYRHMIGNPKYGNLGLLILPTALLSFGAALYLAARIFSSIINFAVETISRLLVVGISTPGSFDTLFFFNTSFLWLTVYAAIIFTVVLISLGSFLSTGRGRPPVSTPLFLGLYGFIVPVWLGVALVRAVFNMGVRWR
jgi:cellulose synthase/poly-beta-1,6-N-acetylglucosamine synthase-like glycosyltransferase